MAALPRAYALLGLALTTALMLIVAYLTFFSIQGMVRCARARPAKRWLRVAARACPACAADRVALRRASLRTGKRTYPDMMYALLGRPGGLALELSIVLRCVGMRPWPALPTPVRLSARL